MKRQTLLVLFLLATSIVLNAQQKKVAVYVVGESNGISKIIGDRLVDAFANNGKYVAIERTSSFLAELSREQSYQRTGAVSDIEISRLGEQFGVDFVCVADLSEAFGEKYVSARLIDVETAEVVNSANASSPLTTMDELMEVTSEIATTLTGKTSKELLEDKNNMEPKIAAFEKKCAEDEAIMQKQLANGYLQIGEYYVTFPVGNRLISYQAAISESKKCRLGGYDDWRLPRIYEVKQINKKIIELCCCSRGSCYGIVSEEILNGYFLCRNKSLKLYEKLANDFEMYNDLIKGMVPSNNHSGYLSYIGVWLRFTVRTRNT